MDTENLVWIGIDYWIMSWMDECILYSRFLQDDSLQQTDEIYSYLCIKYDKYKRR